MLLGDKAIKTIEVSRESHIGWLRYFEMYPDEEKNEKYKRVGPAKFHRKCIMNYDFAISEIKQLQIRELNV